MRFYTKCLRAIFAERTLTSFSRRCHELRVAGLVDETEIYRPDKPRVLCPVWRMTRLSRSAMVERVR